MQRFSRVLAVLLGFLAVAGLYLATAPSSHRLKVAFRIPKLNHQLAATSTSTPSITLQSIYTSSLPSAPDQTQVEAPPPPATAPSVAPAPISAQTQPESSYTRTLVVASRAQDDTRWVDEAAGADPNLVGAVYLVDDPSAPLSVPQNKGHEAMVYLTYIIDHYDALRDITIFMHFHQWTWHNNELMQSNSSLMVQRLRSERVIREGYMNLRCHWVPGCPDYIHPISGGDDINGVPESAVIPKVWGELFQKPLPKVLSQPCCGQFAVSADRIRRIPRDQYIIYQNWILKTPLEDRISGRVWEYLWQYLFAGVEEYCPEEWICYCDGYGICFDGKEGYDEYYKRRNERGNLEGQLANQKKKSDLNSNDTIRELEHKISALTNSMDLLLTNAMGS